MHHPAYTGWHKSSYSNSSANCVEVGTASLWRKSTYSNSSANCVEVAAMAPVVGVRDSKQQGRGPVLEFSAAAWQAFLGKARQGELDL
ncbi:MAG TPA: DUF397 domain-containing protein [Streptosporangiaceae bacterium]|nr:DUF397 domain-containing protein [Streptosporangiaceae bacterium]